MSSLVFTGDGLFYGPRSWILTTGFCFRGLSLSCKCLIKKSTMRNNHEIDYKIYGEDLQFIEVELDPGETVIGEPAGFMMMDDGIEMQTLFGDGSATAHQLGLLCQLMTAFQRLLVRATPLMSTSTHI